MAGRDGRGPVGRGARSGKGLGPCGGGYAASPRAGFAGGFRPGQGCRGQGFGRGVFLDQDAPRADKEFLREQKKFFEDRISSIDEQLKDL